MHEIRTSDPVSDGQTFQWLRMEEGWGRDNSNE